MSRFVQTFQRFDWSLLTCVLALTAVGLVAIYGTGISRDPTDLFPFYKQAAATFLGLGAVVLLTLFDYRHLRSFGFIAYLAGAVLLLLVKIFGRTINGHQGWFIIGKLSFQPVELAKLTLVMYLAALFVRVGHGRLSWRDVGLSLAAALGYAGLVMLQPDFGSAMVMLAIWGIMTAFAGLPRLAWLIIPVSIILIGAGVWLGGFKSYQKDRIVNFLNPASDPRGSGYNAAQARIAIGSGGLLGKGIGEGSQARLRFLPEATNDFMFAVVGEELGFVGVAVVLILFFVILYRYVRLAYESADDFAALLLIGLGSILLIHVVVNAGMNLGVMPITGIPLPFLSAAASYLTVMFLSIGIAESVAARRRGTVEA